MVRTQALQTLAFFGALIGAVLVATQAVALRGAISGGAGWAAGLTGLVFLATGLLIGARLRLSAPRRATPHRQPLSERELEVLRGIALGQSNKTIAANHFRSINTVKTQVAQIYQKLGVNGRVRAVERGRELGLLPLTGENHPSG